MPLMYSRQSLQQESENNSNSEINTNSTTRRILPRSYSRYNFMTQEFSSRYNSNNNSDNVFRPLLSRQQRQRNAYGSSTDEEGDISENSSTNSTDSDRDDNIETTLSGEVSNSENEQGDDDNTTVTESFINTTRSSVDIYRLAIRTNSEILEDLTAIIRILRQINAIYRVFHNSNNSSRYHARRRTIIPSRINLRQQQQRPRPILLHHNNDNDDINEEGLDDLDSEDTDDEEGNKLLEAGLEDLQAILSMENNRENGGVKRQSTLALLALITYQYNHSCSDAYLKHYLDPNGEYNPTLAIFAAATYDEEEESVKCQPPKSCIDIMLAAEELYGPDWLDEFHKGKEGALRKMLEKLTFIAQLRLKVRDITSHPVIR